MATIRVYQLLSNSAMYEHRCLENNNNLSNYSGKCDDQQHNKAIIEVSMVYTPYGFY